MKQGEVWLINLDPTIGAEIKKTRPAIIVNDDALGKLPVKIILPITDWKDKYNIAQWMINILPFSQNGLSKNSSADCFQIRSLSQSRFIKKIGKVSESIMDEIRTGISKVLSIE
jgi:mRNA interferase MazF